jgi:hypothetical protein
MEKYIFTRNNLSSECLVIRPHANVPEMYLVQTAGGEVWVTSSELSVLIRACTSTGAGGGRRRGRCRRMNTIAKPA